MRFSGALPLDPARTSVLDLGSGCRQRLLQKLLWVLCQSRGASRPGLSGVVMSEEESGSL